MASSIDEALFSPYRSILASACLFPSRGNHLDWKLDWDALFSLPRDEPRGAICYSFDWGSAHFVALDTEDDFAAGSEHRIARELVELLSDTVKTFPGQTVWFTQPIEMRINEMVSGVRSDLGVKLRGPFARDIRCISTNQADKHQHRQNCTFSQHTFPSLKNCDFLSKLLPIRTVRQQLEC